jgi:3-ketoacyl-CoA synthase
VYILNFSVMGQREDRRVPLERFSKLQEAVGTFSPLTRSFMNRIVEGSEISANATLPQCFLDIEKLMKSSLAKLPDLSHIESSNLSDEVKKQLRFLINKEAAALSLNMQNSREESSEIMFPMIRDLLTKCKMDPKDIGAVITNCSLFAPTPSLSSMIVNKFQLPPQIKTFSLGGMGCSATFIASDLARALIRSGIDNVLVVSFESLTQFWYLGANKGSLLPNGLFRSGGAAVLYTKNRSYKGIKAKYKVCGIERTHFGASDEAYNSIFQKEDDKGFRGIELSLKLAEASQSALTFHFQQVGKKWLSGSEKRKYLFSKLTGKSYKPKFIPSFAQICIHTGGKDIIAAVQKGLDLSDHEIGPSKDALSMYGNTSSASTWYILDIIEKNEDKYRLKKGGLVWQLGFGSGFKASSQILKKL